MDVQLQPNGQLHGSILRQNKRSAATISQEEIRAAHNRNDQEGPRGLDHFPYSQTSFREVGVRLQWQNCTRVE